MRGSKGPSDESELISIVLRLSIEGCYHVSALHDLYKQAAALNCPVSSNDAKGVQRERSRTKSLFILHYTHLYV